MNDSKTPRPYNEWRTAHADRAEDAAYTFGFHLIQHCRTEALKAAAAAPMPLSSEELQAQICKAVDHALHNVLDLLEGFWRTNAGADHRVEYALAVCIKNPKDTAIERIEISPSLLDLPIGYWKWKDGEFR